MSEAQARSIQRPVLWVALLAATALVMALVVMSTRGASPVQVGTSADDESEATTATTELVSLEPRSPMPAPSIEGHPQEELLRDDPDARELREAMDRTYETGWQAVQLSPDEIGWVPTEHWMHKRAGTVVEVANSEGEKIGYYIVGIGYADTARYEAPGFDWRELADDHHDAGRAAEKIADVQQQGGLSEVNTLDEPRLVGRG